MSGPQTSSRATSEPPTRGTSGRVLVIGIFVVGAVLYAGGAWLWRATWRPQRNDVEIATIEADVRAASLTAQARADVEEKLLRLRAHPLLGAAWAEAAFALDRAGEKQTAIRAYERAEEFRPEDFSLPYCRGILLVETGQAAAAEIPWGRALLLRPNYVPLRVRLARALLVLERPAAAERQLREALKGQEQPAAVEIELARVTLHLGRPREASEHLARARDLAPAALTGVDLGALATSSIDLLRDDLLDAALAPREGADPTPPSARARARQRVGSTRS